MMVWPWVKATDGLFFIGLLLCSTTTVDRSAFYFTRFHYVPVTLVASRTFSIPSCLSHCKLTSQLVLARAYGHLKPLRGESGGGHAPCLCAPCSSQAPPATPVRLLGRTLTHVYCSRQSRG